MCQHWEDPPNSVNHCFPRDQDLVLQNHAQVKDPFDARDRPVDFNKAEKEKFTHTVSDSTSQPDFRKLPLVTRCGFRAEHPQLPKTLLEYPSLVQLHISVWPDFLPMLQPKQHFAKD